MRWQWGPPPADESFQPEEDGWAPIKEPSPLLAQFLAIPLGIVIAVGLHFAWLALGINLFDSFDGLSVLALIPVVMVMHELIHGLFHPGIGFTAKTSFGFWPSKFVFYASYDDVLTRSRFLTILIAPFIVISLCPLLLAPLVGITAPQLAFVSAFNALLACVDLLGIIWIPITVPRSARVRNKGWRTYYQTVEGASGHR